MIRKTLLFIPRVIVVAGAALIIAGAAIPLFWLRDRLGRGDVT